MDKLHSPDLDVERMELLEQQLGPLIDRHLRWAPREETPFSELSDKEYGYMPKKFSDTAIDSQISLRPKQEPLDFRLIAGEILGVDSESLAFEDEIRKIDGHGDFPESSRCYRTEGWYRFLIRSGLEEEVVVEMKKESEDAYRLSTNTEDNVPAYELETMGRIRTLEEKYGLVFPAHREWYRGIWIAEEDAHSDGQNDYGRIRRLTTSLLHKASKNSQLRFGTNVDSSKVFLTAIYTTVQEYATKLAHKRNSILFGPVGQQLQEEESQDETRHYDLYGKLVKSAYKDPRFTEEIIDIFDFISGGITMPGEGGIANYAKKAIRIAQTKIYGTEEQHESIKKALQKAGLLEKSSGKYIDPDHISESSLQKLNSLRQKFDVVLERALRKGKFVLGQTITIDELKDLHKKYASEKDLPQLQNKRIAA
jgi:hypothetical protein